MTTEQTCPGHGDHAFAHFNALEREGLTLRSRRNMLKAGLAGIAGLSAADVLRLRAEAARQGRSSPSNKSVILLWMTGGPSQTDTFDMKPDHENGGPFQPIETAVPGLQISEHLPKLAQQMQHVVPIRSMQSKEGDHSRATFYLRTGYRPQGPIHYPTLGSLISNELDDGASALPPFVSIAPYRVFSPAAFGPGFLGPARAPLVVGERDSGGDDAAQSLQVPNLDRPDGVVRREADARLKLLRETERGFHARHPGVVVDSHRTAYRQAVRLMRSEAVQAFELDREPDQLRDAYGRNQFGQGCLLARRLVEEGVPFVEVSLNGVERNQGLGWDTHRNNFESVENLCGVLDPAWGTLLEDLDARGLLETTLVVWMGEFGRTPRINGNTGRDHYPRAWTTVLCGGGIKGGRPVGKTSASGAAIDDRPVSVPDLFATICHALGIDPMQQNMSGVGRPIRVADPEAEPIREILA